LGSPRFRRGFLNKKAGNALATVTARVLAVRGANRGDSSAMVEYYTGVAARLTQAASIQDLTDNELDEVLNAKTSFNKRRLTDLQNNTADKWVTRDLRLISGKRIRSRFAAGSS
jgi:ethanolamine ammonia-lyase small subunit